MLLPDQHSQPSKHQPWRSVTVSRDAAEDFPLDGASVDRQALHGSASLIKPDGRLSGLAVISLTRPQRLPLIRHIRESEKRTHIQTVNSDLLHRGLY